jgi:hypothetical protein
MLLHLAEGRSFMSPKLGRRVVVALLAVFIAVGFDRLTTAAPATQPTRDQALDALAARNAELQKQVDDLKTQLKQRDLLIKRLEQRLATGPQAQPLQPFGLPMVPVPQLPSLRSPVVPPNLPPGSLQVPFNGSSYYLVPLEGQTVRTGEGTITIQGTNSQPIGTGTITPGAFRGVEVQKSAAPNTITVPARPHQDLIDDRPATAGPPVAPAK